MLLSTLSLLVALAALVTSTLQLRSSGRLPIVTLIVERFDASHLRFSNVLLALLAGSLCVLIPFTVWVLKGNARIIPASGAGLSFLLAFIATILVKLLWAAIEELIYRGAVLPQAARWLGPPAALLASALLFALGHLDRRGAQAPDLLSLLVLTVDGVGFGLAFLATGSLWAPTLWHFAKNLWIWLLYSQSTIQFAPGLFRTTIAGSLLWEGADNQAGLLDLIVTLAIVVVYFLLTRDRSVKATLSLAKHTKRQSER